MILRVFLRRDIDHVSALYGRLLRAGLLKVQKIVPGVTRTAYSLRRVYGTVR